MLDGDFLSKGDLGLSGVVRRSARRDCEEMRAGVGFVAVIVVVVVVVVSASSRSSNSRKEI